jgi:hypothetical protein
MPLTVAMHCCRVLNPQLEVALQLPSYAAHHGYRITSRITARAIASASDKPPDPSNAPFWKSFAPAPWPSGTQRR